MSLLNSSLILIVIFVSETAVHPLVLRAEIVPGILPVTNFKQLQKWHHLRM